MFSPQKSNPNGDLCKSVAADVSPLQLHLKTEKIMEPTHFGCYDNSSFAEISRKGLWLLCILLLVSAVRLNTATNAAHFAIFNFQFSMSNLQ